MSDRSPWDLTECIQRLRNFRDARDWAQFHNAKDLAAAIAIEAAELQELFLWRDRASVTTQLESPAFRRQVESELADIVTFVLYFADTAALDISRAVIEKMQLNEERYERRKHQGIAAKSVNEEEPPISS